MSARLAQLAQVEGELDILGGIDGLVEPAERQEIFPPTMHHADADPAEPDEQVPDTEEKPDLEVGPRRLDPGAAADNIRSFQVIMDQAEQVLRDPVIGVAEREVPAAGGAGTGVARAADVVDRLENHPGAPVTGDRGRAILAVVVDNDDLDRAVPLPLVVPRGTFQRVEGAGEVVFLVPGRHDDREGGGHCE